MSIWLEDPVGNNYGDFVQAIGLKKDDLAAVVGTTLSAFNSLLSAGHRTNLEKIR